MKPSFNPKDVRQNDETLKLLQKHYLDAILTLTPPKKTNVRPEIYLYNYEVGHGVCRVWVDAVKYI